MNQTITGRFSTTEHANAAASLISRYIPVTEIMVAGLAFTGNVAIDEPVIVSDRQDGEDDDEAAPSSLGTAIAAGVTAATVGAFASPVVALAAAGAAIYVGSLAGALNGLEDHSEQAAHASFDSAHAGIAVSIRVDNANDQSKVLNSMRTNGAMDVVQVESDPVIAPQVADGGYN